MLRELNVVITPGSRLWRPRRRLLSHFRFQQPRECGGSSAAVAELLLQSLSPRIRLLLQLSQPRQRDQAYVHRRSDMYPCRVRGIAQRRNFWGFRVSDRKQNLPQLYRFCFLMLGDLRKAQEVFQTRRCAKRLCGPHKGNCRRIRFGFSARRAGAVLEASKMDLQPEPLRIDEHDIAPQAASQIEQLEPAQLAIWISAAPDPQRTALALFYLDEFDYFEILDIAELKLSDPSRCLATGSATVAGVVGCQTSGARPRNEDLATITSTPRSFELCADQPRPVG